MSAPDRLAAGGRLSAKHERRTCWIRANRRRRQAPVDDQDERGSQRTIAAGERWVYGQAARSLIDERDIAEVAVRALTETGHASQRYTLTGP